MNHSPHSYFFLALVLVAAALSPGCVSVEGSGRIESREHAVSGATQLVVCCGYEVTLAQGPEERVRVEADDNIVDRIDVYRDGDELRIEYEDHANYRPSRPVRVAVTMTNIEGVSLSGGTRTVADRIESARFDLRASGGASFRVTTLIAPQVTTSLSGGSSFETAYVESANLANDLSGGSSFELSDGVCESLQFDLSGGSQANAEEASVPAISVSASGGSSARVWVSERLEVDLSGGSRVAYYGAPEVREARSGGSRLRPLGAR